MHVHIYAYTHICMHIYMLTHIYACTYICIHTYMHTHIYAYTHICIHIYMLTHIYACTYICLHTYMYAHIYAYMCMENIFILIKLYDRYLQLTRIPYYQMLLAYSHIIKLLRDINIFRQYFSKTVQ